ncbi:hypothetical protein D3C86_1970160 [compost metagenome]
MHQQHADFEPLLLPVGESAGALFGFVLKADHIEPKEEPVSLFTCRFGPQRAEESALLLHRKCQILKNC